MLKTMSHKLLGYALGVRSLLSDQPLVERLTKAGGDATFSKLVSEIVTSKQFRYRREPDDAPAHRHSQTRLRSGERAAVAEGIESDGE